MNNQSARIIEAKIIWHPIVKTWCAKPYNNKKFCPNFNHRKGCPSNNLNIDKLIDITKPVQIIILKFNLERHRQKMKQRHSKWTFRQLNNVIYWQPKVRAYMREILKIFKKLHPELRIDTLPEGHGVNITRMLLNKGIPISWKYPLDTIYMVAIAGEKLK